MWLTNTVFIASSRKGRDFRNNAVNGEVACFVFGCVLIIMIEARKRTDGSSQHCHWVAVTTIAIKEALNLIMQHGMICDCSFKSLELVCIRKFAMNQ